MNNGFKRLTGSMILLGGLGLTAIGGGIPANAGHVMPPGASALRLEVDKPIIHLDERVLVSGSHFTPGVDVAISLHGPMAANLGPVYVRIRVGRDGDFSVPITIHAYPDAAARQWHTVVVAVLSPAMLDGAQEGAAVAVQADPMPGIDIATRARLVRSALVIDGTEVPALVSARDAGRYRVCYAGHLRAGVHSAYVKWSDAAGRWGARAWSFRIGSPYTAAAAPSLDLSTHWIRLGESLGVAGSNFTPGAVVEIRLGGPNTLPGAPVARARIDATGAFHLVIPISRYPSADARAARTIAISAAAHGAMVGDLPEGVAAMVRMRG